jgi:hypothetical protein
MPAITTRDERRNILELDSSIRHTAFRTAIKAVARSPKAVDLGEARAIIIHKNQFCSRILWEEYAMKGTAAPIPFGGSIPGA